MASAKKDVLMSIIFAVLCAAIFMLPSVERESEGTKERAVVLSVDNAKIMSIGLLKQGEQKLEVEVQSGKFKGEKFAAMNVLRAQMDLDKIFEVGDEALVGIPHGATPQGTTINAQDHYRTGWTFALLGIFAVLLFAYAGAIGVKAVLSFVFSCAVIWKIVVPLCLRGISPIAVCLGAVCVLSAAIIFLVGGLTRKGFSAFAGTVSFTAKNEKPAFESRRVRIQPATVTFSPMAILPDRISFVLERLMSIS